MTAIGTRIRELRVAKGLTQTALAGDGISAGYVSLIESGKRTPSAAMVKAIAIRLGVTEDEILLDEAARETERYRMEVNFARLALASGDPHEAVRTLGPVPVNTLVGQVAYDAALVMAEAYAQLGDMEKGVTYLESLVTRARQDSAWITLAVAATSMIVMLGQSGDVDAAVDLGRAALDDVEHNGLGGTDEHLRLGATYVWALQERGDLLTATRKVEDLISVADRVGTLRGRGSIYWNAAIVAQSRGRVSDAIRLTDRAVALFGEQEDSRDLPRLRLQYAELLLSHEVPQAREAIAQLDRAEAEDALTGSKVDLGTAAIIRGRASLYLGSLDDAAEQAARALQLLGPSDHSHRADALILLGDVGVARYDAELARDAFDEARHVLSGMEQSRATARLWRDLGDSLREFDDLPGAMTAYDSSLRMIGLTRNPTSTRMRVAS
ncbi:MAG: helix-turn-helix domain-containing protein [Nocardioidaceae bacterium]|nr:helix-turn-helix domain-containing protein [Nocardioidaceae bacterium]NUS50146.1 helix-turn-helix domain-containing protein [Nocardioidaceae bacterium]